MAPKKPEMIDVDTSRLEDLLDRAEGSLDQEDFELVRAVFESYAYVANLVEDKSTTIRRLRQLFFGSRSEKTSEVLKDAPDPTEDPASDGASPTDESAVDSDFSDDQAGENADSQTTRRRGHGRLGADAYRGAEQIEVPHPSFQAGDDCPECRQGTLYDSPPGVLVRIVGQAPLHARVYRLQKVRCALCGKTFAAEPPANAGGKKYDATAASMIALLKYGSGLPFNRLRGLQSNLGIPLPASTQWDVVSNFALPLTPAFEELLRQAAQGDVLYNDDTTVKILDLMGQRADQDDEANPDSRTGLFTSGVVATKEGNRIALFFSGRQHAGENLADVLKKRAQELHPPIQMCDALSRNLPGELRTIMSNCLVHGRRQFVTVADRFPRECRYVLEALQAVYRNDAAARQRRLSPQGRLQWHQARSQRTMEQLYQWLNRQFDEKLVEPNSALGGAIRYMLNHWDKLTLFLRKAGAPLDNNLCERALKKAILHRKNALFYKSTNGARIGDLYMSLIHSCELSKANPLEYLTSLQRHADDVATHPERWMPWNYRAQLDQQGDAA